MSVQYPRLLTFNDPADPTGKRIVLVHSEEEEREAIERAKLPIAHPVPTGPNTISNGGVNVDRYGEQLARARDIDSVVVGATTDAASAAEIIRPEVDRTIFHKIAPDEHRRIKFVHEVMVILDMEDNPTNFAHVEELLKKHDINPSGVHEWPKHYYHTDGRDVAVENEEEAKELGEGWSDNPDAQKEAKVKHLEEVAALPTATAEDRRVAGQARARLTAAKAAPKKEEKRAA